MPDRNDFDLSTITAAVIVMSDRVLSQEHPNTAGEACRDRLLTEGLSDVALSVVPERRQVLDEELRAAVTAGRRLVIVLGGTGFRRNNDAPEVVRDLVEVELPGVAELIRAHGAEHSPLAPLSREVVGVTGKDSDAALLLCSPGSKGGMNDTLDVLLPLLRHVYIQLAES
ncbi:Probable molybdopterin binding domain [Propionibacterium ruminifibrarum]|uniref:Probable molybdopterin binding domain n=1 Tax=Propionibacterium ruminifibrarum TaxID=1962131 RepID=A0A375I7A4_9ACTN|nr:molybdopterin-binding protein [Propionibacterium ruminifibrarum]SPF69414.1 Probable molybdopterin binding domain [Propionibacterium ruminifibrarum]